MLKSKFYWLLVLAIGISLIASCSGNSITQPDLDSDRFSESGGPGGPGGGGSPGCPGDGPPGDGPPGDGPPPGGPGCPGWDPDFEIDCSSLFNAHYLITRPNGDEIQRPGRVRILDSACDALTSDVLVGFFMHFNHPHPHQMGRMIPGVKTATDAGMLYAGERSHGFENDWFSFSASVEYELLVFETSSPDHDYLVTAIEGTLHRHMERTWVDDSGELHEIVRDWNASIEGILAD